MPPDHTTALTETIVTVEYGCGEHPIGPSSVTAITADSLLTKFDILQLDDYAHMVPNSSFRHRKYLWHFQRP